MATMRITNLHLIVSFLLLSAGLFFGYQFLGWNHLGNLDSLASYVPDLPTSDKEREAEENLRQWNEKIKDQLRQRQEKARLDIAATVQKAGEALDAARAKNLDVAAAAALLMDARDLLGRAETAADFARAKSLAQQALEKALAAPPPFPTSYVVQKKDTLWGISKRREIYGRGAKWVKIWRANEKKIPDFDRIPSGLNLKIPR